MWPPRLTDIAHRGRVDVEPNPEPAVDVARLVPPTKDIRHLERVWQIDEQTSPLEMLAAWAPADPADELVRSYLIAFGLAVLAAAASHGSTLLAERRA